MNCALPVIHPDKHVGFAAVCECVVRDHFHNSRNIVFFEGSVQAGGIRVNATEAAEGEILQTGAVLADGIKNKPAAPDGGYKQNICLIDRVNIGGLKIYSGHQLRFSSKIPFQTEELTVDLLGSVGGIKAEDQVDQSRQFFF